jgi:hypothetical protein
VIEKPGFYALRSLESRTAARMMLERTRINQQKNIILVKIEHIGHDGREPLPPPRRIQGGGGVTEIVHLAGGS